MSHSCGGLWQDGLLRVGDYYGRGPPGPQGGKAEVIVLRLHFFAQVRCQLLSGDPCAVRWRYLFRSAQLVPHCLMGLEMSCGSLT